MEHISNKFDSKYQPDPEFIDTSNIAEFMDIYGIDTYPELLDRSTGLQNRSGVGLRWFWDEIVDFLELEFYETYDTVADLSSAPQFTEWYPGGKINIAHNVVDRHAKSSAGEKIACLWEGENGTTRQVSFRQLHRQSNQVANLLDETNIQQGDTVGLFMPLVPEAISALYGCFKSGAIAVPLFSGYGTEALTTRIKNANISLIFTADGFYHGGKEIDMAETLNTVIDASGPVEQAIMYERLANSESTPLGGRGQRWTTAVESQPETYQTKQLDSETPSMLLYSSGTTGQPKGTIQTHAGQLVKCAKDIAFDFDHKPDDRFFWLTDFGWIMGPWALIGNHAFGGTVFLYEGAPDYPERNRLWKLIEDHSITTFGLAPTAIRSFMGEENLIKSHDLTSLRILGSTGEPWDPESWEWFYNIVGRGETPIVNVSGGTEMGGHFLSSPPIIPLKPCTVGMPSPGIDVDIVADDGNRVTEPNERGHLVVRNSCPSMTKSLWSGDDRYLKEYWSTWDGLWDHGDWACYDDDGLWYILGRTDDVINVAGRTIGPSEVEAIAIEHDGVTEAAAVGVPDETKGQALILFVVDNTTEKETLRNELCSRISEQFGKPFRPDDIIFMEHIPKNQSGKILRKELRAIY